MSVFRVHKTKDFTVMSNQHLRDSNLTLKAKGLLSVILSLPDDWRYSIAGLAAICKEGTSSVKSALNELTGAGYVVVTKLYPNETDSGRIEYVYDIHETPQQDSKKQEVENLHVESQHVGNRRQLNKEKRNTDKRNKKERACRPALDDVVGFMRENGASESYAERFYQHYESQGWRKGNGLPMENWRAAAWYWLKKDGIEPKRSYPPTIQCRCGGVMHKTATTQSGKNIPYYKCESCGEKELYR